MLINTLFEPLCNDLALAQASAYRQDLSLLMMVGGIKAEKLTCLLVKLVQLVGDKSVGLCSADYFKYLLMSEAHSVFSLINVVIPDVGGAVDAEVTGITMTVPEYILPMLFWTMITGRRPDCSEPTPSPSVVK